MPETTEPSLQQLRQQVADLRADLDRYRAAAQDTLEQVDWCIGYFTAQKLPGVAARLSENRRHIRANLLERAEQPLPSPDAAAADGGR